MIENISMMSMLEDDRDIGWRAEDFNPRRAAKRFSVEELQQEGFSVSQKASLDLHLPPHLFCQIGFEG